MLKNVFLGILLHTNPMIGTSYNDSIRGTVNDPLEITTNQSAASEFRATLNGPQTTAVVYQTDGRDLLIFETCMAAMCSSQHAVIAIDLNTNEQYSVVYTMDGRKDILVDAPFSRSIDEVCRLISCQIDTPQKGKAIDLNPLIPLDLIDLPGGAFCAHYGNAGMILYTEGEGRFIWKNRLRYFTEDGVGTDEFFTSDVHPPLKVEITRVSDIDFGYERAAYSAILNIFDITENRWYSTSVAVVCES